MFMHNDSAHILHRGDNMRKAIIRMGVVYILVIAGILLSVFLIGRGITAATNDQVMTGRQCFIIDAGHGGIDGGAVSCTGVNESVINLQIATRLNDLFKILGYQTSMTRTEDRSIHTVGTTIAQMKASDLKERLRIVNETENAILLSIHQNHFSDSYYYGGQMFYASSNGSKELADSIQSAWIRHLNPNSHRQAKKAEGIYLMKHVRKPAVLIECGFLSNYNEEQLLRSDEYQKHLCCVIATVCAKYYTDSVMT